LARRPEGRHVAHDHLERPGGVERGQDHVRVGSPGLAGLSVTVMTAFARDPRVTAAPPRVLVAHDEAEVEPDLRVRPPAPVRGMPRVESHEEGDVRGLLPGFLRGGRPPRTAFVEPAPVGRHLAAEGLDGPPPRQLHDHLVLLPLVETNTFSVPLPFTA
jgi:hypothetical protein